MDDFFKDALALAKAQASVRVMTENEMPDLVSNSAAPLKALSNGESPVAESAPIQPLPRRTFGRRQCPSKGHFHNS